MTRRICYVAHPVGVEPERTENLERTRRWLRYLIAIYPDRAFALPWLPYCQVLDETPVNRARGIADDLAMLVRCDEIFLVGGRVSPGMAAEVDVAVRAGLEVLDLTALGPEPPRIP